MTIQHVKSHLQKYRMQGGSSDEFTGGEKRAREVTGGDGAKRNVARRRPSAAERSESRKRAMEQKKKEEREAAEAAAAAASAAAAMQAAGGVGATPAAFGAPLADVSPLIPSGGDAAVGGGAMPFAGGVSAPPPKRSAPRSRTSLLSSRAAATPRPVVATGSRTTATTRRRCRDPTARARRTAGGPPRDGADTDADAAARPARAPARAAAGDRGAREVPGVDTREKKEGAGRSGRRESGTRTAPGATGDVTVNLSPRGERRGGDRSARGGAVCRAKRVIHARKTSDNMIYSIRGRTRPRARKPPPQSARAPRREPRVPDDS